MSRQAQLRAFGVIVALLATFAGIVLFVARFEAELKRINWPLVSVLCAFAFAGYMIYQWQRNPRTTYDISDLVMKDGKADPYRHLLWVFGGLGAWSVVQVVLAKEWPTLVPLLGLLLGYFVAKPMVDGVASAITSAIINRGAPPQAGGDGSGGKP